MATPWQFPPAGWPGGAERAGTMVGSGGRTASASSAAVLRVAPAAELAGIDAAGNATRGAAVAPFPPPWWPGVRATPAAPFLALGEPSQALHVALPLGGRAFYLLSSLEGCRRYRTLIET